MTQTDWIGGAARPTFRDIRNQRESKASRKAELCLQLGRLCGKAPPPPCSQAASTWSSAGSTHANSPWRPPATAGRPKRI